MKYEDLSFNIINDKGIEVICDITAVIPNPINPDEPYVMYTDYMLDENDEFRTMYGKVIEVNDEFKLQVIDDVSIIEMIDKLSKDEIVNYVNTEIQNNISE